MRREAWPHKREVNDTVCASTHLLMTNFTVQCLGVVYSDFPLQFTSH